MHRDGIPAVRPVHRDTIDVDGAGLTLDDICRIANRRAAVTLTRDAVGRAGRSQDFANATASRRPLYGRSTGVGANRTVLVAGNSDEHALKLLRSHATSAGERRSAQRVRAMLVVRLNQLAAGGSGVDPLIMQALLAMINADALPDVRELGSIGTADLPALAVTARALIAHESASPPVTFRDADGLAFISSNAGALGDAALAVSSLAESADAVMVIAALTFHAVGGNAEAYSDVVRSRVTPFPGAAAVCDSLQRLVGADSIGVRTTSTGAVIPASRIQDPFGLRAIPQVHGPVLDALRVADTVVKALVNAPGENPVVLADDSVAGGGRVAHHGGFHSAYLQMALDSLAIAIAQSGQLVLSRLAMLIEPGFTELTPFLGDGTPGASGVMVCEYVAASALGSIRAAATPAGLQTASLSRGVEEDASFASLAATQCLSIAEQYRQLLACELVTAVRANRMRSGHPIAGLIDTVMELCTPLSTALEDRDLSADLATAARLLPSLAKLLPFERPRASTFGP